MRLEVDQAAMLPSIRTWVNCPAVTTSVVADRPCSRPTPGLGDDGWSKLRAQMQLKDIFVADFTDPRAAFGGLVVEQLDVAPDPLRALLDKAASTVGADDAEAAW